MYLKNKEIFVYAAVILLCVILTYSNHFNNSFHFDDSHTIENNLYIKSLSNIPLFFKDASSFSSLPSNQTYRPLVSTSLAIDHHFAGGLTNKFYFHFSMFIVFLLQGILMYFLFTSLLKSETASAGLSLFAVAWYMLHPACAETINYIIARSDLISTMLVVLAFVLYLRSSVSKKYHLYLLPIIVGALAKITVVMFAPMLFIYSLLFEQDSAIEIPSHKTKNKFLSAFMTALPSFLISILIYFFIRSMDSDNWVSGGHSTFQYIITQPYVILHYVFTFFLPNQLSADTDWTALSNIIDIRFFIGMFFVASLVTIAFYTSRKKEHRVISFGICWFLLALVPTSSVIPFSEVMNDHRVFFPYVGLSIAVVKILNLLVDFFIKKISASYNRIIMFIVCGFFLLSYAYGTYQRNEVWRSEETLWKDVTIKSPKNARGHMNYGLTQMAIGNYEDAEKSFSKTLELWPYYAYGHVNMGILLDATGRSEQAEQHFKNAISYNPGLPEPYFRYANFLFKKNRLVESRQYAQQAVNISPAHIDSRYMLMEVLLAQKEFELLEMEAQKTLEVIPGDVATVRYLELSKTKGDETEILLAKVNNDPTPQNYLNLSLALYQKGDFTGCIEACQKALAIDPNYADAYNNICSAYNQLKEWDKAIQAGNKAMELNPNFILARNNLNWAILNKSMQK